MQHHVQARPRAFHPDYIEHAPRPAETPHWDVGLERQLDDGRSLARGLAWFSIGLGLVELFAPRTITGMLGVDDRHTGLVRFYGLRGIASGVGILSERTPTAGVSSRVGGDALDLATLGLALRTDTAHRAGVFTAMAAVAGVAALDIIAAKQLYQLPPDDGDRRYIQ